MLPYWALDKPKKPANNEERSMKKAITTIISSISYLLIAAPAFAAATDVKVCPEGQFLPLCTLGADKFGSIVGTLVTVGFVIAVVIALGFLVWGGIRWIVSGGDKAGVESARNTIIAAIIGLVIVFLSYFILSIILGFFKIDLQRLQLPQLSI